MKKFSTSLSKASKIAAAQQHTSLIGEQLSAPIRKDDFANVERIPVYAIRPDPQQARRLGITLPALRDPESVTDAGLREKAEHIAGLAQSLIEVGQEMPIVVYRDGSNYRLVSGERRWWAAQLAELETLVAKVLTERPDDLRLKQYVENAVRVDFTPAETLEALRGVVEESERLGKPVKTA
jgi:ParB/RepB/Spo0J family partition protein